MSKRQRYVAIVSLVVLLLPLLAGCTPNPQGEPTGVFGKYLVKPISDLLDVFFNVLGNYAWAILLMTFLVRLVVFPLTWKQQKGALALQEIQPQIKKLQDKYKKDQQKLQQEMMKLFQENNYNPMAGCLPLIIQMPILLALYQAIMYNKHIGTHEFLYLKLGAPDPYYILPILAAFTTYLTFVSSMSSQPQQGPNPMKAMIWFMPIMVFVLAFKFPAALSMYWVFGNVISVLQQVLIFTPMKNKRMAQRGATR